jgi:hypothetical protein
MANHLAFTTDISLPTEKQLRNGSFGKHYQSTRQKYLTKAKEIFDDFIIDELGGEKIYKQLRYEAACECLKEIFQEIMQMPSGKTRQQAYLFYQHKLAQLEKELANYSRTPYTI